MKPISRSQGRSAVAAAAYRAGVKLTNERDGITHDFTRKKGIAHSEIILPKGVAAEWARDRSALWNAAEFAEKRKDARIAREFEIALPHEMTDKQRLDLTRAFVQDLANRYGAAVDFAIHTPHGETDIRNYHAHILMTTRTVATDGLGDKTNIERENKWLLNRNLPTSHMQLRDIRQSWELYANEHLAKAGFDLRIDHRSHIERGLEIEPTQHMGVHATQMQRRGKDVYRSRQEQERAQRNAVLIREKPEEVLTLLTDEKSVFDKHDIARVLHRYIDEPAQYQNALAKVMASPALVELQPEQNGTLARYSTHEMIEIESGMAQSALKMNKAQGYEVNRKHIDNALITHDNAIRSSVTASTAAKVGRGEMSQAQQRKLVRDARLSDEQRKAIKHVTGQNRVAAVVGHAGAGKSTMLAAAREAWEAQGYKVHGAALAGKAAEGLEESSGIQSRTLASYEYGWQNDRGKLSSGDVLVIDEAGMLGSKQLARFVDEAEQSGAKLVLVGDHEQLQAIGAGAPFRAIAERVGAAELQEIRRQREDWQREASTDFASHRTDKGLAAYDKHNAIKFNDSNEAVRGDIVRDYMADRETRPEDSRVALAHRRVDVQAINDDIRANLQERGELAKGEEAGEVTYETNNGERSFAQGDRIVFLENNRELAVKNGMLGTVEAVEVDSITARLDGQEKRVSVPMGEYKAVDHGYATTIHKSQGATVDRAYVMASRTMDRHLTYVAMTRHRDSVQLYADKDEFKDVSALSSRLSRTGAKENTLDYIDDYAQRRGINKDFNVNKEDLTQWRRSSQKKAADLGRKKHAQDLASKDVHKTTVRQKPEQAYDRKEDVTNARAEQDRPAPSQSNDTKSQGEIKPPKQHDIDKAAYVASQRGTSKKPAPSVSEPTQEQSKAAYIEKHKGRDNTRSTKIDKDAYIKQQQDQKDDSLPPNPNLTPEQ